MCACVSRHLEAEDVVAPDDTLVAGPRPVHGHVPHLHTALYTRASNEGSPEVDTKISQSRRRPLLARSHLRHYAKQALTIGNET